MYNEIIFVSVDNVHNYLIRMKHPTHCPSLPRQIYSNCSLQVEIDDLLLYKSIYFEDVISVAFYDLSEYTSLFRFISKSNKKDSCCKNLKPLQHSHTNLFLICHKIPTLILLSYSSDCSFFQGCSVQLGHQRCQQDFGINYRYDNMTQGRLSAKIIPDGQLQ